MTTGCVALRKALSTAYASWLAPNGKEGSSARTCHAVKNKPPLMEHQHSVSGYYASYAEFECLHYRHL
jgi:hypothetical protein